MASSRKPAKKGRAASVRQAAASAKGSKRAARPRATRQEQTKPREQKAREQKPAARKPGAASAARRAPTARPAPAPPRRSTRRRGAAARGAQAGVREPGGPIPGLSEEDQIRAAKFLPRELPKRLFEEERFLFPESYGVDRVRLLVRDPEWIFAYWDVSPEAMRGLGKAIGERALALSRLTLRILDPSSGAVSDILLPAGARWWYVRTDATRRSYRAELGVTLPSGEFRRLAESNVVVTPRVGPSSERARRKLSYDQAVGLSLAEAAAAAEAERRSGVATAPWPAGAVSGAGDPGPADSKAGRGGASDAFGPRPGASDSFRR